MVTATEVPMTTMKIDAQVRALIEAEQRPREPLNAALRRLLGLDRAEAQDAGEDRRAS